MISGKCSLFGRAVRISNVLEASILISFLCNCELYHLNKDKPATLEGTEESVTVTQGGEPEDCISLLYAEELYTV